MLMAASFLTLFAGGPHNKEGCCSADAQNWTELCTAPPRKGGGTVRCTLRLVLISKAEPADEILTRTQPGGE
jgi:hypothetical protein